MTYCIETQAIAFTIIIPAGVEAKAIRRGEDHEDRRGPDRCKRSGHRKIQLKVKGPIMPVSVNARQSNRPMAGGIFREVASRKLLQQLTRENLAFAAIALDAVEARAAACRQRLEAMRGGNCEKVEESAALANLLATAAGRLQDTTIAGLAQRYRQQIDQSLRDAVAAGLTHDAQAVPAEPARGKGRR